PRLLVYRDPSVVSIESGKRFQSAPDAAFLPEPGRSGDDQHIPAADTYFNRAQPVAERLADLALELPLDRFVRLRLGHRIVLVPALGRRASRLITAGIGSGRWKKAASQRGKSRKRRSRASARVARAARSVRGGTTPARTGRDIARTVRSTARRACGGA